MRSFRVDFSAQPHDSQELGVLAVVAIAVELAEMLRMSASRSSFEKAAATTDWAIAVGAERCCRSG